MRLNKKLWIVVVLLILAELMALGVVLKINEDKKKQVEEELAALRGDNYTEVVQVGSPIEEDMDDVSPWYFTPYNGYMDECTGWLYYDRFVDKDYDGDGEVDRVYREEVLGGKIDEESKYRIELSSGQTLLIEKTSNGLPMVEAYDFDMDGDLEILFTCSFDFSSKADYIGLDVVLFDKEDGVYKAVELPFEKDKNKYFMDFACGKFTSEELYIEYQVPSMNKVSSLIPNTEVSSQYIGKKEEGKLCDITMLEGSVLFKINPFYDDLGRLILEATYENGEWTMLGYSYSY